MHPRRKRLSLIALAAFAGCLIAAAPPAPAAPAGALIGQKIADFELKDFTGKPRSLAGDMGSKGVVLIFVSTRCPVSNAYNERMVELAGKYQAKGFAFLGINANKAETPEEMADHAGKHDWNFPVLKDPGNKIADRFGASVTPEVFLVDSQGVLRYHGRIDDSQDPAGIEHRDLEAALDAILGGEKVPRTEAKAFGCSIKRV